MNRPGAWKWIEVREITPQPGGTPHILTRYDVVPCAGSYELVATCYTKERADLVAAAPSLLACQTMGAQLNTPDFLDWIADRLVYVHGEKPNMDYVLSLRSRAEAGRRAIIEAEGGTP